MRNAAQWLEKNRYRLPQTPGLYVRVNDRQKTQLRVVGTDISSFQIIWNNKYYSLHTWDQNTFWKKI